MAIRLQWVKSFILPELDTPQGSGAAWAVWLAGILVCAWLGGCLRPWAEEYARRLEAGALPVARTLWQSAGRSLAHAGRRGPWCWQDRIWAVLGALWALVCLWPSGPAFEGAGALLLGIGLAALAWLDLRSGLLPDALTWPLMLAGWYCNPSGVLLASSASALMAGGLVAVAGVYRFGLGRDGMGQGDIKYLAALAAWSHVGAALTILLGACLLGLAWHALRLLAGTSATRPGGAYPFGPCLSLAALPVIGLEPGLQSWF